MTEFKSEFRPKGPRAMIIYFKILLLRALRLSALATTRAWFGHGLTNR